MKQLFRYIREDVDRLLATEVWQLRKPPPEPPEGDPPNAAR